MKYIDADKLINLVREWRNKQMGFAWDAVNEVLKIVNSLQQEQPEVDLVMEYDEQFNSDPVFGKLANRNAGIAIARHFYELGLNARKEE